MTPAPQGPEERVELWRCSVHGWIEAERLDPEDNGPRDECPVPGYDEEPCGEKLASPEPESFVPQAQLTRAEDVLREIAAHPCSGIGSPPSCACRSCLAARYLKEHS